MSTGHIRHCPKHKALLPCRFCAQNPPKKVGAPLLGDHPLTAAERQQRRRDRRLNDATRLERAEIVKRIRKRIKDAQHGNIAGMRRALHKLVEEIATIDEVGNATISITRLRELDEMYRIHDRTGRKEQEAHTGSKDVEAIHAAHMRDSGGAAHAWGSRKPKTGASPDVDLEPLETGTGLLTTTGGEYGELTFQDAQRAPGKMVDERFKGKVTKATTWDKIETLAYRWFWGDENEPSAEFVPECDTDPDPVMPLHCKVCDFDTDTWVKARAHIEEMFKAADKQYALVRAYEYAVDQGMLGCDVLRDAAQKEFVEGLPLRHAKRLGYYRVNKMGRLVIS